MTQSKSCLQCGSLIIKPVNESQGNWEQRHKFCSKRCIGLFYQNGKDSRFSKERHYVPSTAYKKGHRVSPKSEFKKGSTPWNKGKKGVMPTPWNKGKHHLIGSKHPMWKGASDLITRLRGSLEMKAWKKAVMERDGHKCVDCGSIEKLDTHHLKPVKRIVKESGLMDYEKLLAFDPLWDLANGITVCKSCHSKIEPRRKKVK